MLQFPWQVIPTSSSSPSKTLRAWAIQSVYVNGVDPGFITDLIPLAFASTCRRIEQVRCMEIADYATYDGATVMFDVMGFGKPPRRGADPVPAGRAVDRVGLGPSPAGRRAEPLPGFHHRYYEREPAPEAFDIAAGHIPQGGVAAVRFEINGMVGGARDRGGTRHTTAGDLRPDWAQLASAGWLPTAWRSPGSRPTPSTSARPSRLGDHNHAGIAGAAARIVNAIPAVVEAPHSHHPGPPHGLQGLLYTAGEFRPPASRR